MDKNKLPPGPYTVDDKGDMYNANGKIISMMAHAEPCDRIVFMNHLAKTANGHSALVDGLQNWFECADEHDVMCMCGRDGARAALKLAEGGE